MAFIELKDVTYEIKMKGQPNRLLMDHLNLAINKTDMVALLGPNGVGKTTLTKLILGILQADKGRVALNGREIGTYKRAEVGRMIGYLFQNPSLQLFNASLEEELLFAYAIHDRVDEAVRLRYGEVLKDLSLEEAVHTSVVHLSQGEKQRLALGTLLMNQPDFMILDEPTSGLDDHRKGGLKDQLLSLHSKGMGMMIVTHDHEFIKDMPLKVLEMSGGQVAYET